MKILLVLLTFISVHVFAQNTPADPAKISSPTENDEKNEDVKGTIVKPTPHQKKVVKDAAKKAKKKKLTKKKKKKKDRPKK